MNVLTKLKCLLGMHQGEWTTGGGSGCWQKRSCMFCGITEQQERHNWPYSYYLNDEGEYFEDGSCETRVTCLDCETNKYTGKRHAGPISFWNYRCRRCGEDLGGDGD